MFPPHLNYLRYDYYLAGFDNSLISYLLFSRGATLLATFSHDRSINMSTSGVSAYLDLNFQERTTGYIRPGQSTTRHGHVSPSHRRF